MKRMGSSYGAIGPTPAVTVRLNVIAPLARAADYELEENQASKFAQLLLTLQIDYSACGVRVAGSRLQQELAPGSIMPSRKPQATEYLALEVWCVSCDFAELVRGECAHRCGPSVSAGAQCGRELDH